MAREQRSVTPQGGIIRHLRVEKGLTVSGFASLAGLSVGTVGKLQRSIPVDLETLNLAAAALGVDVAILMVRPDGREERLLHSGYREFQSAFQWMRFRDDAERPAVTHDDLVRVHTLFERARNHTAHYSAGVRSGQSERDPEAELRLSDEWLELATAIAPYLSYLPTRTMLYSKARYWAEVDLWSDDAVKSAGLELKEVTAQLDDWVQFHIDRFYEPEQPADEAGGSGPG